ncbi:MAG: hypothetical protein R3Y33_07490, partial [Clostridia bacterium]
KNEVNKMIDKNEAQRPNPRDAMKNRLPASEMKAPIEEFLTSQNEIYISVNNNTSFPDLEIADYRYVSEKFIVILTPASVLLNKIEDGSEISTLIFDKQGRGLKSTRRIYGQCVCKVLSADTDVLLELAKTDGMIKKMLTHGAKFLELEVKSLTVMFPGNQIFSMDKDMTPSFAKFAPNGKERFENSRHVLMEYDGRQVIFNTIIEDGVYYTLTKENSNKVNYIKNAGECMFFDGRDNHFSSKMTILPEDKVQEIFEKLQNTNNSFFKKNEGLIALSYQK